MPDWPFDSSYNYNYQTETFNLVRENTIFKRKDINNLKYNRWLKFIDGAYVIGTGKVWDKFKIQSEYQDLENITHYSEITKIKDLNQKFVTTNGGQFGEDYFINATGCHISHVNCCEDALKNNYENIIIMEDDCYFTKYITDDEINKLVELRNLYNPNVINLAPHSTHNKYTCNRGNIELIQMPTFMTHFIYVNKVGMNQIIKTKYERPHKPFRLSGTGSGYIDRDWFGGDDFWYSFTNSYVLGVPEDKQWAIQYVSDDSEDRNQK